MNVLIYLINIMKIKLKEKKLFLRFHYLQSDYSLTNACINISIIISIKYFFIFNKNTNMSSMYNYWKNEEGK